MHHMRASFLCGIMTFLLYVMLIRNMFNFKRNAYHAFLSSVKTVYYLEIRYDQDKFSAFCLDTFNRQKAS